MKRLYNINAKNILIIFLLYLFLQVNGLIAQSECEKCHESATPKVMSDYKESTHSKQVLTCTSCHGGNDKSKSKDDAHSTKLSFKGKLSYAEEADLCGSCHAAEVKYSTGNPHFSAKGRWDTVKCINCHGAHKNTIPAKGLFISQEEGSCNSCHKNKEEISYTMAEDFKKRLDDAFATISTLEKKKDALKDNEARNVIVMEYEKVKIKFKGLKSLMHNLSLEQAGYSFHEIESIAKSAIVYAEMLEKKANEKTLITLILVGMAIVAGFFAASFVAAYILLKIIRWRRSKVKII